MKKLMSLMLGLSMLAGTTALFAADKDAKDTNKTTTTSKHKKNSKKNNKKMTTAPTSAPVKKS